MLCNKTVVISGAGRGTRMGSDIPKSLLTICGKPLIYYQLELLKEIEDVRIVVGFQAEKLIETVRNYRQDVTFVYNHDYMSTGTGASFSLGAENAKEFVLAWDGDLLVYPEDLLSMLKNDEEVVGVSKPSTEYPVYVNTRTESGYEYVDSFSTAGGKYEWTGLAILRTNRLSYGDKHVYQIIEPLLPIKAKLINTREIDTPADYLKAVSWIQSGYIEE